MHVRIGSERRHCLQVVESAQRFPVLTLASHNPVEPQDFMPSVGVVADKGQWLGRWPASNVLKASRVARPLCDKSRPISSTLGVRAAAVYDLDSQLIRIMLAYHGSEVN